MEEACRLADKTPNNSILSCPKITNSRKVIYKLSPAFSKVSKTFTFLLYVELVQIVFQFLPVWFSTPNPLKFIWRIKDLKHV